MGERPADVLVLGAGIVGLSIAHALREAGVRRVTVLDRGRAGEGSTMRATGGIRVQFGNPVLIRLSLLALEHWRTWSLRYRGDVSYRRTGYLFLATSSEHMASADRALSLQRSLGARVERLGQRDLARRLTGVRLEGVLGGTLGLDDGLADPGAAVVSLVRACRRRRVTLLEGLGDASLATSGGRVIGVRAGERDFPAEVVVVATGAWTAPVLAPLGITLPIEPHHRQAYRATRPAGISPELPMVIDRGTGVYFHPDGPGLIFGGGDRESEPGWDARYRPDEAPRIVELLTARLPAMADAELAAGWAGLREMTPDDLGVVGPIEGVEGLFVAAGFSGHGFMHSPAIGELVAAQLTGRRQPFDVAALSPSRFAHPLSPDAYAF
jgi:sarcosine oxidase subunit beta